MEHFSSTVCLLSFLWLLWFTLAQIFVLGQGVPVVAIPLGLATGLSGFTSLVKEVRKLALALGISVHMLQHNWVIRANSCQRLILQLFLRVGSWGDFFAGSNVSAPTAGLLPRSGFQPVQKCSSQGQGFLSVQQLILPLNTFSFLYKYAPFISLASTKKPLLQGPACL